MQGENPRNKFGKFSKYETNNRFRRELEINSTKLLSVIAFLVIQKQFCFTPSTEMKNSGNSNKQVNYQLCHNTTLLRNLFVTKSEVKLLLKTLLCDMKQINRNLLAASPSLLRCAPGSKKEKVWSHIQIFESWRDKWSSDDNDILINMYRYKVFKSHLSM